jgi:hypothetical protein
MAIALAALTYHFVERPVRYLASQSAFGIASLALLMIVTGGVGLYVFHRDGLPSRMPNQPNPQHDAQFIKVLGRAFKNCHERFPDWNTSDNPCMMQELSHNSIAVVGDSHAGMLFPGLTEQFSRAGYSTVDFPASCAAPFIDVISAASSVMVRKLRENNYRLIDEAYDYIIGNTDIKVVLLAHSPACSFGDAKDANNLGINDFVEVLRLGMRRSLTVLFNAGKEVAIVLDDPFIGHDPHLCSPRPLRLFSNSVSCWIPKSEVDTNPAFVTYRALVEEMQVEFPKLRVIDLSVPLCNSQRCTIEKDGRLLYSDASHLNVAGSEYVMNYYSKFIYDMLAHKP